MDTPMLHLVGPSRDGGPAMIAGEIAALKRLRAAINVPIEPGTGSTELFCSDGEPYNLLIASSRSMRNVYTAYAGDVGPLRSLRELLPLAQLYGVSSSTR